MTVSLGEAPARGENALKPPSPVALTCEVKGTPALAKGASLFESAESGPESASFGGVPVGLNVVGFPASAAQGRVKVRTTNGVRIDGWLDTAELPLYAAVDLPVLPGHLWVAQGERLSFFAASTKVTVEAALDGSVAQKIRVESPCSALALEPRSRAAWDIPGSARGYVPRHQDLALRQEPGAQVAYTLKVKDPATSMLLWSTEARDGYVHVLLHRDIVIDAWVAASDLIPLKTGETMDQPAPPSMVTGSARLLASGPTSLLRTASEVPLRLSTREGTKAIGSNRARDRGVRDGDHAGVVQRPPARAQRAPPQGQIVLGAGQRTGGSRSRGPSESRGPRCRPGGQTSRTLTHPRAS